MSCLVHPETRVGVAIKKGSRIRLAVDNNVIVYMNKKKVRDIDDFNE